uniref:Repressor protein n=1 Tax=Siphoviridae sp. ct47J5 TaxID=2826286 RepID=A0A8S5MK26_9CAUD|nr:MAG TPA: repressor protein [Siphoviridae sp. ct47J5]
MFYDLYNELCQKKGVSCSRAAKEIGLSNSTVTKWKNTGATPSGDTLSKVAAYFGVSVNNLIGEQKGPAAQGDGVTDDDIKFALFGGGPVTDAQYEEVKQFVRFIKERDANGNKG